MHPQKTAQTAFRYPTPAHRPAGPVRKGILRKIVEDWVPDRSAAESPLIQEAPSDPPPGYLNAVWPNFVGAFLRSGRPRGPGIAFKNVRGFAPHIFEGFPGPPGLARPQTCTPKNQPRLPSGTQPLHTGPQARSARGFLEKSSKTGSPIGVLPRAP